MTRDFYDYFTECLEYPSLKVYDPIPWGQLWVYVSDSYLNAFINHVHIQSAWLIHRYRAPDETLEWPIKVMDPPGTRNWVDRSGTKREMYNLLCEPGRLFHTEISCLGDDVLILADMDLPDEETKKCWAYFWFDRDCSDSCIGRFKTNDLAEVVKDSFDEHARQISLDKSKLEPWRLPLTFFGGWLKG